MTRLLRLIALLVMTIAAYAQAPSADWRTITTAHFRVHYPAPFEAWASRAASRLESIRDAVVKEVGFDPPQRIDVIVSDPIASANGLAYPFLDTPRIFFFTHPPGPEEQIGAYSDWIDVLATHEVAHIVHMLRPSRNPAQRLFEKLLFPLDPITFAAPRWVLEGYATVIEGRLTGAGRPPGTMRAVVLREWAATGRLPSYSQLNSDTRFLGMSMAYLAGSAYLEWLERRTGEGSLRKVWARMTARQRRSFATAFTGVFGDTPQRLYGKFVAELTASALTVNRTTELREGELWQEAARASGDPALSADGSQIVIVQRPRSEAARLVVWSTGPAEEEGRKFTERIERMIGRDPEDVPPVRSKPLPRKVVHSFRAPDGGDIETPRWIGNSAILMSHRQPDREGFLHFDLFVWNPTQSTYRRVTHLADVYDADPWPDGRSAIAIRSRYGASQLVRVDLESGAVSDLTAPALDTVYSHPRVSWDGKQIAYVAHRVGNWSLFVRELDSGRETAVITTTNVSSPEWSGDDIIATLLSGGFAELHRIDVTGGHQPLTRSSGGAFQPAPSNDGRVFFMGLDPDGFMLRVIDGKTTAPATPPYDPTLIPALPVTIASPVRFASERTSPPRAYGIGRQELNWLVSETVAPSQSAFEAGVRIGDVVGRLDTFVIGSIGHKNGQRGAAVASAWRGWPVDVSGHLFNANDRLVKRNGFELRGSWSAQGPLTSTRIDAGALTGKPFDIGFAGVQFGVGQTLSAWRAGEEIRISAEAGTLRHYRGVIRASLRRAGFSVLGQYQHDESRGESGVDVGGVMSSILPLSAIPNRVFDPALPIGTLSGRRYDGARFETTLPGFPATIFYQRHRTQSSRISLAGFEVSLRTLPAPVLRYPALDFTAGVARFLDEALRNRTRWWFATRWRP